MTLYDSSQTSERVQVWDLGVRLFHWSRVSMVALTYAFDEPRKLHRTMGYIVVALIAFRLVWGMIGVDMPALPTLYQAPCACWSIYATWWAGGRAAILATIRRVPP